MLKVYGIIVFVFAAFMVASGDKKDAVKVVDLAEQLAKSREETKQIIQRENDKLRREDDKLKQENDKLKQEDNQVDAAARRKQHFGTAEHRQKLIPAKRRNFRTQGACEEGN